MEPRLTPFPGRAGTLQDLPLRELEGLPLEELPEVLGVLETARVRVLKRYLAPEESPGPVSSPPPPEPYLTVDQAADLLHVKRRWVYEHLDEIQGAQRLSRKCIRIPRAGLKRLLARRGLTP